MIPRANVISDCVHFGGFVLCFCEFFFPFPFPLLVPVFGCSENVKKK